MAKNDLDVEDLGDLDDIDLPEFGDDYLGGEVQTGLRSALPAPAITFANELQSDALNVDKLRQSVLNVLPHSYSDAYALGDTAYSDLTQVYSEAKEKLKPEVNQLKKTLKRAVPMLSNILPEKMTQWLDDKLSVEESHYRTPTQAEMDTAQMTGALENIFALQSQQEAVKQEVDLAKTAEREERDDARTEYMGGIQKATHDLLNKLVSYQDRITSNYQRQSLELQFKQFFVTRDLLQVSQATFKDSLVLLRSISHNTFIPDALKETNVEAYQNLVRERIFGALSEPVSQFAGRMIDQFRDNVKQGLLDIVQGVTNQLSGLTSNLSALLSTQEQQLSAGESRGADGQTFGQMGLDMAASGAATGALGKVRGKLERWLKGKVKDDPRVLEWHNKLSYWLRNKESFLLDARREPFLNLGNYEFLRSAIEWLQDRIPTFSGERETIKADLYETSYQKVDFDKITRRSIIEIIPGFLSRILQQVTITNTGNKETERLVFDVKSERFQTLSALTQKTDQGLVSNAKKKQIQNQFDDFFDVIDKEKTLSEEAKAVLSRQILRNVDSMERFNPFELTKKRGYQDDISDEVLNEITERMTALFKKTDTFSGVEETETLNKADQAVVNLRSVMPEIQSTLNKMIAAGRGEVLQEAGWITPDNKFNFSRYFGDLAGVQREPEARRDEDEIPPDDAEGRRSLGLQQRGGRGRDDRTDRFSAPSLPMKIMKKQVGILDALKAKVFDLYDWLTTRKDKESTSFRLENRFTDVGDASDPSTAQNLLLGIWQNTGRIAEGGVNQTLTDMLTSINTSLLAISGVLTRGEIFGDRSILRTAGEGLSRWIRSAGTMAAQGYGAIGSGFELIREGFQKGMASLREKPVLDIYITGEDQPVLTARGLRKRRYLDVKSNKVIQYIEDITGPVKDIEDNYNEVLSQEDFEKGLFARDKEGRLSVIGGKLMDLGSTLIGGYTDIAKQIFKLPGQAVEMGKKFYKGLTLRGDLYLPGSDKVVLSARILRAGGYFDANGQPIFGLEDIKTDIFNSKGELVLALDDLAQGLFYKDGKKADLRGLIERLGDTARRAASWAGRKAIVVSQAVWKGLKGVGRRITGQYKIERTPLQTFHDDFPPEDMDSKLRVMLQIRDLLNIGLGDKRQSLIGSALSGAGQVVSQAVSAVGTVIGTPWRMVMACKDYLMEKMGNILPESVIDTLAERMASGKETVKEKKEQWKSRFRRPRAGTDGSAPIDEMAEEQARSTTILDDIRKVLSERLEEPEQIRAGSWQERMAQRREQAQAAVRQRKDWLRRRRGLGAATAATQATSEEEDDGLLDTAKEVAEERIIEDVIDKVTGQGGDEGGGRDDDLRPERRRDKIRRWGQRAWSAAKGAALSVGGMVLSGGSLATAGSLITGAIGTLLSAPVIATGAVLAAGATAAYKAYQWYTDKTLRKPVKGELEAYRLRQYGFDPEQEDRRLALRVMENKIWKDSSLDAKGALQLEGSLNDYYEEFFEVCALEEGNREQAQKWAYWFRDRFVPLLSRYKRQCSLLKIDSLADLEKLKDQDKLTFLNKTNPGFNEMTSPYRILSDPFGGTSAYPAHVMKSLFAELIQSLEKRIAQDLVSPERTAEERAPLTEPAPPDRIQSSRTPALVTKPDEISVGFSDRMVIQVATKRATPKVDSWEEYRFTQYGFLHASINQTKVLRLLEADVAGRVKYAKDGTVSLTNANAVFDKFYKEFGLTKGNNINTNVWLSWFYKRFFPIFKRYVEFCSQFALPTLDDIETISDQEQATQLLLNVSTFSALENPYAWLNSPFVMKAVLTKEDEVKQLAETKQQQIKRMALKQSVALSDPLEPSPMTAREAKLTTLRNKLAESQTATGVTPPAPTGQAPTSHFTANLPKALAEGDQRVEFINPVNAPISSRAGSRYDPFTGRTKIHKGIDYAAPRNTPIVASGDGTIERVATSESFGNVIEIRHANGLITRYAHMNGFADGMKKGLTVKQGELIGYVGNTGRSKGNHLHFEMRAGSAQNDAFFDPERLLGKVTSAPGATPTGVEKRGTSLPTGGDTPVQSGDADALLGNQRKVDQVAITQRALELQRTSEMNRGFEALERLQGVLSESLITQRGIEQVLKAMSQTLQQWSHVLEAGAPSITGASPPAAEPAPNPTAPVRSPIEPPRPPLLAPVSWKRRLATT